MHDTECQEPPPPSSHFLKLHGPWAAFSSWLTPVAVTTPSESDREIKDIQEEICCKHLPLHPATSVSIVPGVTPSQFWYSELIRRSLSGTQAKALQLCALQEKKPGLYLTKERDCGVLMSNLGTHSQWHWTFPRVSFCSEAFWLLGLGFACHLQLLPSQRKRYYFTRNAICTQAYGFTNQLST